MTAKEKELLEQAHSKLTKEEIFILLKDELSKSGKYDQIVITGGTALKELGLVETANDLDVILINPDESTITCIKGLQEKFPAETKPMDYNDSNLIAVIKMGNIKLDIFKEDKILPFVTTEKGLEISLPFHSIEAKKKQSRMKDWIGVWKMANRICTQTEFLYNIAK